MTADKVVDFLLGDRMTVLKLVQRGKLVHVETVRCHDV